MHHRARRVSNPRPHFVQFLIQNFHKCHTGWFNASVSGCFNQVFSLFVKLTDRTHPDTHECTHAHAIASHFQAPMSSCKIRKKVANRLATLSCVLMHFEENTRGPQQIGFFKSGQKEIWPNPYTGCLSTPMASGSHLLNLPQSRAAALRAKTTGAGKMKTTGWKMLVDSILVCLWLVNEQWGRFLNHLSCRWNSWTPTPDTDQGGKRLRGTTRSLNPKWDSARLKLTVISQTVCERQRRTLRKAEAQIFTQNTEWFDTIWHKSLLMGPKLPY